MRQRRINIDEYVATHRRKPNGKGYWTFAVEGSAKPFAMYAHYVVARKAVAVVHPTSKIKLLP